MIGPRLFFSVPVANRACTLLLQATIPKTLLNPRSSSYDAQEASLPNLGMFPFTSLKEEVEAEPERAFVVDIGGGRGQSLLLIQKETGSNGFGAGSKMILQDRPQVLDTIPRELLPGIEKMSYDFYTEQPVKSIPPLPLIPFSISQTKADHSRRTYLLPAPHNPQLPRQRVSPNPHPHRRSDGSQIAPAHRRSHRSGSHRSRRGSEHVLDGYGDDIYRWEGEEREGV